METLIAATGHGDAVVAECAGIEEVVTNNGYWSNDW